MEQTSTPDINVRTAAELSFSHFLLTLENDKQQLKKDFEKSTKMNITLNQENIELKKQIANSQAELQLAKKKNWCHICEKETKMFAGNIAICSENCLKNVW